MLPAAAGWPPAKMSLLQRRTENLGEGKTVYMPAVCLLELDCLERGLWMAETEPNPAPLRFIHC